MQVTGGLGENSEPNIVLNMTTFSGASGTYVVDAASCESLAFDVQGKFLAGTDSQGILRLWKLDAKTCTDRPPVLVGLLRAHEGPANCVGFGLGASCRRLVTGGDDHLVKLWDLDLDGEALAADPPTQLSSPAAALHGHSGEVNTAAFDPSGRWLLSGGADETIRLWDCELLGERLPSDCCAAVMSVDRGSHDESVFEAAFSPDGMLVTSVHCDRAVRTWELRYATEDDVEEQSFNEKYVTAVCVSPSGGVVAAAGGRVVNIHVVAEQLREGAGAETMAEDEVMKGTQMEHITDVTAVAFSSDMKFCFTGATDGIVRLWDLKDAAGSRTQMPLRIYSDRFEEVLGKRVAAGTQSEQMLARFEAEKSRPEAEMHGPKPGSRTERSIGSDREAMAFSCSTLAVSRVKACTAVAVDRCSLVLVGGFADWDLRVWEVIDGDDLDTAAMGNHECRGVLIDYLIHVHLRTFHEVAFE